MSRKQVKERPRPSTKERVPWTPDDGLKLRAARQALGLSQAALAHEVGCCGSRIRELELDVERRGPPSPRLAAAIAEFFRTHQPAPSEPANPRTRRAGRGQAQAEPEAA